MSDEPTVIPMTAYEDGPAAMRKWSEVPYIVDGVHVYVDGADAHFQRAKDAGATILSRVKEGAVGKRYRAEDLEGHRWMFTER